jgi:succinyl-CoA:acetate CoA-transferase
MMLENMHDIPTDIGEPPSSYSIVAPTKPILAHTYLEYDLDKIIGIVMTDAPDRNSKFADQMKIPKPSPRKSLRFWIHEVKQGRLPRICRYNLELVTLPTLY